MTDVTRSANFNAAPWTSEQDAWLMEQRAGDRPIQYKDLIPAFKEKFGIDRTVRGLNQRVLGLQQEAKAKTRAHRAAPEKREDVSVYGQMQAWDEQNLARVLGKRDEFIYGLMRAQAEIIAGYESVGKYHGMTVQEILKLPARERKQVQKVLAHPPKRATLDTITLLAAPSIKNPQNVGIILPLYADASEQTSIKKLGSALRDVTLATLLGEMNFAKGRPFEGSWHDLVEYQCTREARLEPHGLKTLGERISAGLAAEYSPNVVVVSYTPLEIRPAR